MEGWPQSLKTTVAVILPADAQIVLFWGPEFIALYNDSYAPTIGDKHPRALGRPAKESWSELWDDLGPLLQSVRDTGKDRHRQGPSLPHRAARLPRNGLFRHFLFGSPDESGAVGGVLCIVRETTDRVRRRSAPEPRWGQRAAVSDRVRGRQRRHDRDRFGVAHPGLQPGLSARSPVIQPMSFRRMDCLAFTHPEDIERSSTDLDRLRKAATGFRSRNATSARTARPSGSGAILRGSATVRDCSRSSRTSNERRRAEDALEEPNGAISRP